MAIEDEDLLAREAAAWERRCREKYVADGETDPDRIVQVTEGVNGIGAGQEEAPQLMSAAQAAYGYRTKEVFEDIKAVFPILLEAHFRALQRFAQAQADAAEAAVSAPDSAPTAALSQDAD